ncbi:hypothetical protein BUALT_Bualt13G0066100 [Buddleja alternifolia]|uniref:RNase H type-1 domain-containing protein n=1 Tax=Buddleja alternifolia TaxID=168488 RepID=A0AAV6WW51_9LAMI|nr:hypothetical protein BUALT_Bualt13G0066100 [Buddleja alternifolia]
MTGFIKINFDGAVDKVSNRAGLGVVGRDLAGNYVSWSRIHLKFASDPEHIEALTGIEALRLARRENWEAVEVEGDYLLLINKLCALNKDLSAISHLVDDILSLSSLISVCSFSFTKRLGNVVAHNLARVVVENLEPVLVLPPIVVDSIVSDISALR